MKIGIVTFTFGDNFGQRLQNLATQQILKSTFNAEVITLKQQKKYGKKEFANHIVDKVFRSNSIQSKRRKAFEKFNSEYIKFSDFFISEKVKNNNELSSFDYFVVGSDQVWSPYSSDVNSTMFLTFAPREKRVALAPSMAATDIPSDKLKIYREYLNGFNYISVREQQSADIIKKYFGLDSFVLIDPTLMFGQSFWNAYAARPSYELPERYVLCYFLGNINDSLKKAIEEKTECSIVDILNDSNYYVNSPSNFIYLIKNASYVMTDSYHGTIFSILYDRPLSVVNRTGTNINMNSRFDTLNAKLDLNLEFSTADHIEFNNYLTETRIDLLNKERNKFNNYLRLNIKEE